MKRLKHSLTPSLCIDYGSGYRPAKGYKTSDITGSPVLDYFIIGNRIYSDPPIELPEATVTKFRLRNVVHHVPDLTDLFTALYVYLIPGGTVEVIDCAKRCYKVNVFLDKLWYRFVLRDRKIWISETYRDYVSAAVKAGFRVLSKSRRHEKDIVVLQK